MRVVVLGFALPPERFTEFLADETGMPAQTQRFGTSIVRALESAGATVTQVSAAPARNFPHNRRIRFSRRCMGGLGKETREIGFLNLLGAKHLTRYSAARLELRRVCGDGVEAIVVHGVHSPFLWAALHEGRRAMIPVIPVVTDRPSQRTHMDNMVSTAMKSIDRRVIKEALRRVQGGVALAARLADELLAEVPSLIVEGIAPEESGVPRQADPSLPPIVVYAGTLRESYGVLELLKAATYSAGDWLLHVYGRGPMETEVREAASRDQRIVFHGLADQGELALAYARASLLVNPRPPEAELSAYSFPSKVLEYLVSGAPVMSTRVPSIPPDYATALVYCESDAQGLAQDIDRFLALPLDQREAQGRIGMEFAHATRGPRTQGGRIIAFIRNLDAPSPDFRSWWAHGGLGSGR